MKKIEGLIKKIKMIDINKKQSVDEEGGTLTLLQLDADNMNICPVCHYETTWIKNKIESWDKSDLEGMKFSVIYKCYNCKDIVSFNFWIFTESHPILEIQMETKKSQKAIEELEKYNDTVCENCGRGENGKQPKLIKLKKLPDKPIMYLKDDLSGYVKTKEECEVKEDDK